MRSPHVALRLRAERVHTISTHTADAHTRQHTHTTSSSDSRLSVYRATRLPVRIRQPTSSQTPPAAIQSISSRSRVSLSTNINCSHIVTFASRFQNVHDARNRQTTHTYTHTQTCAMCGATLTRRFSVYIWPYVCVCVCNRGGTEECEKCRFVRGVCLCVCGRVCVTVLATTGTAPKWCCVSCPR